MVMIHVIQHELRMLQRTSCASFEEGMDALNAWVAELLMRIDDLQREAANWGPILRTGIPLEPEPHANNPPVYDGDLNACQAFLSQCSLVFSLQPRHYATEEAKVAYVLTLLSGCTREWGIAVWNSRAPCCAAFEYFRQKMAKLFDQSAQGVEAATQLSCLSQRKSSVTIMLFSSRL